MSAIGKVGENNFDVFWCGDNLNSTYYGDTIFQVVYSPSTGGQYVPDSNGDGQYVYVTEQLETYYEGYWVAQDSSNLTDTRLIDVLTTCNAGGTVQHVYASCKTNGCSVRETANPSSLWYWNWADQEF